jgi:hypothetical protein
VKWLCSLIGLVDVLKMYHENNLYLRITFTLI